MAPKPLVLPRIAYLTGLYPLVSLTFIEREIAALRDLGAEIHTVSVRETEESQHSGPEGRAAAASTHYLLREAKNPLKLVQAQLRLFKSPGRYFFALRTAWRLRNPGLKSMLYQMIYFLEATLMADFVDRQEHWPYPQPLRHQRHHGRLVDQGADRRTLLLHPTWSC